jgi:hypothetical protein
LGSIGRTVKETEKQEERDSKDPRQILDKRDLDCKQGSRNEHDDSDSEPGEAERLSREHDAESHPEITHP